MHCNSGVDSTFWIISVDPFGDCLLASLQSLHIFYHLSLPWPWVPRWPTWRLPSMIPRKLVCSTRNCSPNRSGCVRPTHWWETKMTLVYGWNCLRWVKYTYINYRYTIMWHILSSLYSIMYIISIILYTLNHYIVSTYRCTNFYKTETMN